MLEKNDLSYWDDRGGRMSLDKNLKMKIRNNTFHTWWHEQQFFGDFIAVS